MDLYEKQLLESLRGLGGTGNREAIMRAAYFPNASLPMSADALIASGLVEVTAYFGNNPSSGWSELTLTGAGHSAVDSF